MGVVWCKRAWEVRGVEHGRVDGCLQVMPKDSVSEEKLERPLVLLVASGCAEREAWFAVAKCDRRAERCPRPLAAFQMIGVLRVEVEHLGSGAEAEAEAWNHRRALQPSAARGAGDKVPMTVGDRYVHGVATHRAEGLGAGARPVPLGHGLCLASRQPRLQTRGLTWPQRQGCPVADQPAAFVRVSPRQ